MRHLVALVLLVAWMGGLVIAKGFWSTLFAIFPLWAYYLVVEQIIMKNFSLC
jgi:hypothetical protein